MERSDLHAQIETRLKRIYRTDDRLGDISKHLAEAAAKVRKQRRGKASRWSEQDIILITYGDSILEEGERPLRSLRSFLAKYLAGKVSHVHILPFFPYSSDDGFSVIDYYRVDPKLGDWEDVRSIAADFGLMADLVINHISRQSNWFQNYLNGKDPGEDYFIEADQSDDLSKVVRPRSLPLLTPVETIEGTRWVWTTFSDDQIDLNFSNPKVLLEMMKVFLFYLEQGAQIIRLDAIAFLWKEIGTTCLHLPQTHEVVKLMRDLIDYIDPNIILITETNVPNKENLSYFGAGDEANMVYQFSLPPLLLHALHTANVEYLTRWAATLTDIPPGCTFFNFTASHDGIGVRPLEGLLPREEILELTTAMQAYGGRISTKRNADGSDSPYEMNITYLDALKHTRAGKDKLQIERFICSQTIMMSFKGIPAFYIHSLIGTHNNTRGVARTGMNRTINRRKWNRNELYPLLDGPSSHQAILYKLSERIALRKTVAAFHPDSPMEIPERNDGLFVMFRGPERELTVLANFSTLPIQPGEAESGISGAYHDLLGKEDVLIHELVLRPYQVMWLQKKTGPVNHRPCSYY